jgi:hypothetical protein
MKGLGIVIGVTTTVVTLRIREGEAPAAMHGAAYGGVSIVPIKILGNENRGKRTSCLLGEGEEWLPYRDPAYLFEQNCRF